MEDKEENILINEDNNIKNELFNNNKEKSFDRLCRLQKLIKKESALKELCKK